MIVIANIFYAIWLLMIANITDSPLSFLAALWSDDSAAVMVQAAVIVIGWWLHSVGDVFSMDKFFS